MENSGINLNVLVNCETHFLELCNSIPLLLTQTLLTSKKGVYAIGGSISPSYMEIQPDGTIKEKKHSNLIFMSIQDALTAMEGILSPR